MTSLNDAVMDYLQIKRANGRADATAKWYESILGALVQHFGEGRAVDAITGRDMTRYILGLRERGTRYTDAPQRPEEQGGLSSYSIQSHIRALKAFWLFATDEYMLERDPMRNIKTPRLPPPKPKAIPPRDVIKLLQVCGEDDQGHRNRAMILFLADTGARVGGLCSLSFDNLDIFHRYATVTEKGGEQRKVFFTYYTSLMLGRWLQVRETDAPQIFTSITTGRGLSESGVYQVLKRLGKRAGVGVYNPHAFRDGFAVAWIKAGGDLATLARLLGHKDVKVTADHYALFADDELQEVKSTINPLGFILDNR